MPSDIEYGSQAGDSIPDLADGFSLAGWRVDPRTNRAGRDGHVVNIEPRVMQVLLVLVRHAGQPVTRDRLMEAVWTESIVTDDTLTRCISEARKVFDGPSGGDGGARREGSVIETIPKVGYRLVAPVTRPARARPTGAAAKAAQNAPPELAVRKRAARPGEPLTPRLSGWRTGAILAGVVVVVSVVVWAAGGGVSLKEPPPAAHPASLLTQPVPATSMPGRETMAAWSPDGEQLAFVHTPPDADRSRLLTTRSGDTRPLSLFEGTRGSIRSPVWMPDGRTILFAALDDDNECRILSVPALGGAPSDVHACTGAFVSLDVSPDGRLIALDGQSSPGEPTPIRVVNLDSGATKEIEGDNAGEFDYAPVFSRDGASVLFSRSLGEGQMDLFEYHMPDGPTTRLTTDRTGIAGYDWVSGDRNIIYTARLMGIFSLLSLNVDSGDRSRLGLSGIRPDIDDSGRKLVYETFEIDTDLIAVRENSETPVCASTRNDQFPVLDSSARSILFVSNRRGSMGLFRCYLADQRVQRIPIPPVDAVIAPSVSPDDRIAFSGFQEGQADIFVIDRDGEEARTLTSSSANDVYPVWSADGNWIYFGSDRAGAMDIWRIAPGGSAAERVTHSGGMIGRPSASGRWLYYQKEGKAGLWRTRLNAAPGSESPEDQVASDFDLSVAFNWHPVENGILTARSDSVGAVIEMFDPETGIRTAVRQISEARLSYGTDATEDLSLIVVTRTERVDADLMVAELNDGQ